MATVKTKVTVDFLCGVSRQREANAVRYWLAMRCLDERGAGWVVVETAIPQLASLFGVKSKTVSNMLYKLESLGLGNFGGDKFFLYNEKRVAEALNIDLQSNQAVWVTWEDLRGPITKARATFDSAVLATKGQEKAITRAKRRELTGRSRTTQIKYDRIAGTQTKHNYAVMMPWDEWWFEYFSLKGIPVFKMRHHGVDVIARVMANTYQGTLKTARKRLQTLRFEGEANRVFYFSDFKKALHTFNHNQHDVYYQNKGTWYCVAYDTISVETP